MATSQAVTRLRSIPQSAQLAERPADGVTKPRRNTVSIRASVAAVMNCATKSGAGAGGDRGTARLCVTVLCFAKV
jgi:hypothetical protein